MAKIIFRSALWAIAGAVLLPMLGVVALMVIGTFLELFGVERSGSGGSGGFEMGLANLFLLLIPIGAVSFFVVTIARGLRNSRP